MADFEMQDWLKIHSPINLGTIGAGTLDGRITGIGVHEHVDDGTGTLHWMTNTVIRSDSTWRIAVNWELFGTKLDQPAASFLTIQGNWVVRAYLEGWGENAGDHDLKGGTISVMSGKTIAQIDDPSSTLTPPKKVTAWQFLDHIVIGPSTLVPKPPLTSIAGPYKLAVTLTYEDSPGKPGPMAGFIELPHMIQIYDPS